MPKTNLATLPTVSRDCASLQLQRELQLNSHPNLPKGAYKTYLDNLMLLRNLKFLKVCYAGLDKSQLLQSVKQAVSLNTHSLRHEAQFQLLLFFVLQESR